MPLPICDQQQPMFYLAPFSHSTCTSVTDRQTDRQTDGRPDDNHDNSLTVIKIRRLKVALCDVIWQ